MEIEEFKELLVIDKNALDEECQKQASMFFKVSEQYANAVSDRDYYKDQAKELIAELSLQYKMPTSDSKPPSDKVVENKVISDPVYKEATQNALEAKIKAERWGNLKESFIQKAQMIKHLCELYVNNYYSEISVKGNKETQQVSVEQLRGKSGTKKMVRRSLRK